MYCICRRHCQVSLRARRLSCCSSWILAGFPEVARVFGKVGRAETATDPAPLEMVETTVQFKPREQWRDGMTMEKLIEDLDRRLQRCAESCRCTSE
jgi:Cu(I)/Ag(I) efflux system membrane protein CusA/SilA